MVGEAVARPAVLRRRPRLELCLPTSPGGHLELLSALAPAYTELPHLFVTPTSRQADQLRAHGHRVTTIVNPHRSVRRLPRNTTRALRLALRERPRIVVSSGAGLTVPFCLAAKALGAKLIFIETMARVDGGSASGRILYPFADHFLVQWPELLETYPKAEVCRPPLLERISDQPRAAGEGTFVATGNHTQPFDRLLRLCDEAARDGALPTPVLAQVGASRYRPEHMEAVESLPPAEVKRQIAGRRVVVTHGGAGLISVALGQGRRPLVLSRRRASGEHVNDHLVAMTRKLADVGAAVSLDDVGLAQAVTRAAEPPRLEAELPGPRLVDRLHELLRELA